MTPLEETRQLVQSAQLQAIDFLTVSAQRNDRSVVGGSLVLPDAVSVTCRATVATPRRSPPGSTSFRCSFAVRWHDGAKVAEGEQVQLGVLDIDVRLAYVFGDSTMSPSYEVILGFGREVALHQAWPFLRERAHSMSMQIGFPALVLPLHFSPSTLASFSIAGRA